MTDYPATPAPAPYREATSDFEDLVKTLFEVGAGSADHAAIEQLIEKRGTEVLRKLLEATLNERASRVKLAEVEGADAIRRTHHRSGQRVLESLFGSVLLWRDRLGARGATALVPADASLNLPLDHFSFGVRARVVSEVVRGSYDAAVAAIAVTTGADVAKRQAESLVISAAQDFDAFYTALERAPPDPGLDPGLLVISVDGKGIVMRPNGLREATRKAADKSAHKIPGRLSRGEKANRKRMATVAAIYDLEVQPRSVDDILGDLRGEVRERRPRPKRKRIWASVEKSSREAIADAFDEACARDPLSLRPIVVLVDGAWSQIRETQTEAKRRGRAVTIVLDIIHVIEYLWTAAWNVFEEGDPRAKKWVGGHLRTILEGRAGIVAGAMRRCATNLKLTERKGIDKAANYILNHKSMMRYDQYLAEGMPIATGVIEGACRHLVKDRMDITGARWGLEGAEAVLRLRSLWSSGDLDCYLDFHRQQEAERNHLSHYANNCFPWVTQEAA